MNMPTGWEIRKLGDVCSLITDGKHGDCENQEKSGFYFVSAKDIYDGKIHYENARQIKENDFLETHRRTKLEPGDILLTNSGTIGKTAIAEQNNKTFKTTFQKSVAVIKPLKTKAFNKFLMYFLSKSNFLLDNISSGSSQKNLLLGNLRNLEIPLPPIPTQIKIANILEKADALKQKRKQANKLLDELLQSVFLDMFGDPVSNPKGWEFDKLGEVCEVIMGQSPNGESYNDKGMGVPLLNGPTEFGIKYPVEKQWTTEPTKFCKSGDILFCVRGATAGRMNFADKEYCIGRGLAAIRNKKLASLDYVYLILKNLYNFFQKTSNGSTFINICGDDLKNVKIPKTPIFLQNEFASIVEKIQTLKDKAKKSEIEIENLFNSLMQKAFNGELEISDNIVDEIQNEEQKGQLSLF